mgnify:CR=1 FL=1
MVIKTSKALQAIKRLERRIKAKEKASGIHFAGAGSFLGVLVFMGERC